MRSTLAVALLFVVGIALWLLGTERTGGSASASGEAASLQRVEDAGVLADPEMESGALPQPRSTVELEAPGAESEMLLLSGTVTVSGRDQLRHAREDGKIEILDALVRQGREVTYTAPVAAGAWSVEVFADAVLLVSRLELGGKPAHTIGDSGRTFEVPASGRKDLEARWFEPATLRVVSRDSGLDLGGLLLAGGELHKRFRGGVHPHPGPDPVVVLEGVRSPVQLWPDSRTSSLMTLGYHVRAPGFAWAYVALDYRDTEPKRLELVPGGDLEVRFTGRSGIRALRLGLRSSPPTRLESSVENGRLTFEFASIKPFEVEPELMIAVGERRTLLLEGLTPGAHQLRAWIGPDFTHEIVASAQAEVEAGSWAFVELFLPPEVETVSTDGPGLRSKD